MKRVLMLAYHFPPMNQSSGIQRTLRFAQYLPALGWEPRVLTVRPLAYPSVSAASLAEIPTGLEVRRSLALDASRHLAIAGRYSRLLCLPDRWWSWWLTAVPAALAMIRRSRPDVLWSTFPIATAHLVGHTLHRLTAIPWVADFRDPMAQEGYPAFRPAWRAYRWVEERTLRRCARAVFTTPGALRMYAERYPGIPRERLCVIENGYDESSFAGGGEPAQAVHGEGEPLLLIHSGTVYPSERDPRPLFAALSALKKSGSAGSRALRLVLRAPGNEPWLRDLIATNGVEDLVSIAPSLPYREALAEMMRADALVVLQASNCNDQVPAKLYEYLRAGRPILALTDPAGDTAAVLRGAGIDTVARLDSREEIERELPRFLAMVREARAPLASAAKVAAASREARSAELARVFESLAAA